MYICRDRERERDTERETVIIQKLVMVLVQNTRYLAPGARYRYLVPSAWYPVPWNAVV